MHSTPPQYSKLLRCLSIQAAWQQVATSLAQAGIEDAGREAGIILQHATRQSPTAFYSDLQRTLADDEVALIDHIVTRRRDREPLQYILNSAYFYGREFHVAPGILIPRPDTETIVDAFRVVAASCRRIVDVGTGSGAIAITLACEFPHVHVLAIDRSRRALDVAGRNATRHAVCDRVCLLQADLLSAVVGGLDAIVANLPYIRSADIDRLEPEVALFEPREALDGGADGLDLISRLCIQAARTLRAGGHLLLEVGDSQAHGVLSLLEEQQKWHALSTAPDLRGIRRVVSAVRAEYRD